VLCFSNTPYIYLWNLIQAGKDSISLTLAKLKNIVLSNCRVVRREYDV
jgi:hypothetical protein